MKFQIIIKDPTKAIIKYNGTDHEVSVSQLKSRNQLQINLTGICQTKKYFTIDRLKVEYNEIYEKEDEIKIDSNSNKTTATNTTSDLETNVDIQANLETIPAVITKKKKDKPTFCALKNFCEQPELKHKCCHFCEKKKSCKVVPCKDDPADCQWLTNVNKIEKETNYEKKSVNMVADYTKKI